MAREQKVRWRIRRRLPGALLRVAQFVFVNISEGPALTRLGRALIAFALTLSIGVAGYMLIEGIPFVDALYQTVITLTTIGFQEVHPLGQTARVFTIFISIFGVAATAYLLAAAAAILLEGDLYRDVREWRMARLAGHLQDHVIIAAAGRVGWGVARVLHGRGVEFVLVDSDQHKVDDARREGWLAIHGDARDREVLEHAGAELARSLVIASHDDATNTFVMLTALSINSSIFTVARCNDSGSEPQLKQAGAAVTFSPMDLLGGLMAQTAARGAAEPQTLPIDGTGDAVAVIEVDEATGRAGRTAAEIAGAGRRALGVRTGDGAYLPADGRQLEPGDAVITAGPAEIG